MDIALGFGGWEYIIMSSTMSPAKNARTFVRGRWGHDSFRVQGSRFQISGFKVSGVQGPGFRVSAFRVSEFRVSCFGCCDSGTLPAAIGTINAVTMEVIKAPSCEIAGGAPLKVQFKRQLPPESHAPALPSGSEAPTEARRPRR